MAGVTRTSLSRCSCRVMKVLSPQFLVKLPNARLCKFQAIARWIAEVDGPASLRPFEVRFDFNSLARPVSCCATHQSLRAVARKQMWPSPIAPCVGTTIAAPSVGNPGCFWIEQQKNLVAAAIEQMWRPSMAIVNGSMPKYRQNRMPVLLFRDHQHREPSREYAGWRYRQSRPSPRSALLSST